ncbi:coproporphyrinogen III oxidase [Bombiscardovia nodaiensis]|uniref:Heme chaperone HemW n=1 Tax=Bombiscardovia nodaiensis TaxID=2932181 RepID=A0ABM8B8F1_9BIFI|nr:coproporphyrinogen III oxidase [Bombiscardovia nodaiensis]
MTVDMTGGIPFELYVHVPFCLKRCGYCDFNTYTSTDLGAGASREHYADLVIQEMELTKRWQEAHGIEEPALSSIFFGGGTPTVLPAKDLVRIVRAAHAIWGIQTGAEITTEANPDTVDGSYLEELAAGGFTRVSFGMQSAVPHVLATLDRTHTPANVTADVRAAQRIGLECSVDLIYGTPGESLEDWRQSVNAALDLDLTHISAYALTLEPTTKMGRQVASGSLPNPDDDDEADKYELADALFHEAGFEWYEISNWAQPGHESRHNLGYWRNVDWAGIGPGAHSHYHRAIPASIRSESAECTSSLSWRKTGEVRARKHLGVSVELEPLLTSGDFGESAGNSAGESYGLRAWDIRHPKQWALALQAGREPWAGSESIGRDENLEECVMLGLRLREGLALGQVSQLFGRQLEAKAFAEQLPADLFTLHGDRLIATRRGRLLNDDLIAAVLDVV